jgi:glycine/D-amino acid oxidase-like deaminating enzyme
MLPADSRGFRVRGAIAPPAAPGTTPATGTAAAPPATGAGATPPATGAAGRGAAGAGGANNANRPPAAPADPLQQDPDTSSRWASQERIDGSRRFLAARFPLLANAPLLETRACHYESSVNGNFIIDHVPDTGNAWIAGVGQAEGFKFAPLVGEYVAQRVLGNAGDPKLVKAFKLPTEQYEAITPPR